MRMVQRAQEVAEAIAADVLAGRLGPGDPVPTVRALARQLRCAPGTAARAHGILRDAGVIGGAPRSRAVVAADGVAAALMMGAHQGVLRLSGSDDPALDLLLSAAGGGVERAVGGRGSVAGLGMLAQGAVDAAAVHLRDARTGRYNDVFARRVLGGEPARLVHLWRREQGIVVPKGNPLGIRGMADLDGVRLAWRPPGTGSRLLLNRLLLEAGAVPAPEGELCDSHFGVAVAVAVGAVDAGLAVRAVAEAVDADFLPVEWEDFELAVSPRAVGLLGPLLDVLASTSVHQRVSRLGGYELSRSGESRVAACKRSLRANAAGARRPAVSRPAQLRMASLLVAAGLLVTAGCGSERPRDAEGAAEATGDMILATTTSTQDSGLLDDPAHVRAELGLRAEDRRGRLRAGDGHGRKRRRRRASGALAAGRGEVHGRGPRLQPGAGHAQRLRAGRSAGRPRPCRRGRNRPRRRSRLIAQQQAPFASRADNSGTNAKELSLWEEAGSSRRGPGTSRPDRGWARH